MELQDLRDRVQEIHWMREFVTPEDHGALLLEVVARMAAELRERFPASEYDPNPVTHYEHEIWKLGEDLRIHLVRMRKRGLAIRGQNALFDAVAEIGTNPAYGHGRSGFLHPLVDFGRRPYRKLLVPLLEDREVRSTALWGLRILGDGRFVDKAREMRADRDAPGKDRHEALQYLKRFAPER